MAFKKDGFIVLPSLFSKTEQKVLFQVHDKLTDHPENTFSTSHWSKDQVYRTQVHESLNDVLSSKIQPYLNDYKSVYSYFLVKHPGKSAADLLASIGKFRKPNTERKAPQNTASTSNTTVPAKLQFNSN